jgi:hypothetical protein
MILKCSCQHKAQDKFHGTGKRVHKEAKDVSGGVKWRCTVCLKEQSVSQRK